jgi:hypothetical protein
MIKMRAKFFVAALLAASASAIPAKATTTLAWTLSNVTFADGATATGTFTTDSTNGNLVSYNLFTTAGSSLGAFHYDANTSKKYGDNNFGPNSFLVQTLDFHRYINLEFNNPLTGGGFDAITITNESSFECNNCNPNRYVTAGYATSVTASVPEPLSWALMVVGFGLVGVAARRRTTALPA